MTADIQTERVARLRRRADKLANNRELINKRFADAVERLTEARARQGDLELTDTQTALLTDILVHLD